MHLRKGGIRFPDDRICGGGPTEGFGVLVVFGEVSIDSGLKLSHRRKGSPTDGFGCDTSEEALDHVEPGTARRREVKVEALTA